MPLAADVDKLAPPALAVVVPAAAKVPTVRTVVRASVLKSVGKVEAVVAVAGIPMPSKFCVYAVVVDKDIAARTTTTDIKAITEIEATMNHGLVRGRRDPIVRKFRGVCSCLLFVNIGKPLGLKIRTFIGCRVARLL